MGFGHEQGWRCGECEGEKDQVSRIHEDEIRKVEHVFSRSRL